MFPARNAATAAAAALLLLALAGCGKDDEVGPEPSDITGTWIATKVEFISKAAPATRVDVIAQGSTAKMVLGSDRSFLFVMTDPGMSPDTTTGVWALNGDVFKVTQTGMSWSWEWDVSLKGNALTLTGASGEFDFDDDDVMEEAEQNMAFVR